MKLSIIIPCFNEKQTLPELLKRVRQADIGNIQKEIILVDDASTDGTADLIREFAASHKTVFNERNEGKGACIRKALPYATGDFIIIQDADLEYDPNDYAALLNPLLRKECRVVYGSRERNKKNKTHSGILFYLGGLLVTKVTNILFGSQLTDVPTCYKMFDGALLKNIPLTCQRFEFCPEVTAKLLKRGIKIKEVPIQYHPRTTKEGKKIRWRDGVKALFTLLKYRL